MLFQTCNLSNHDLRESLFEIHLALFIQLILLLTVFIYYTAISYIFRKKFIVLRTALGFGLAYFIIRYCDARLNAASITVMALIFLYFYFRNDKQRRLFALLPLSAGIASSVMIYLSSKFTWSHPMYVALNNFFSMRLHLGHEALKKICSAVVWDSGHIICRLWGGVQNPF